MNTIKMLALVLIAGGILGLMYGSFSYTRETQEVKIGPLEMTVQDKKTVDIPVWAGVTAIVAGGGLLLFASKNTGH